MGPSHIDTFDYKPNMTGMDGKTVDVKISARWSPERRADCRAPVEVHSMVSVQVGKLAFPNVAKHVDDIAFLNSMTADSPIHGFAMS